VLTVKFRQASHEFTFGVGMNIISYPLVLTEDQERPGGRSMTAP
jgi:hypothetical protein